MTARLPRGQTCQDGNFTKNGDFTQEGESAKKGNVAAVGKFAKDSNVMKRPLMMQPITMHCKWCRDWVGTIATKGARPALQRQQRHCKEVKEILAAIRMQHGNNTCVTGNDTSKY